MNKALKKVLVEEAKKSGNKVVNVTESHGFIPTGFPFIDSCVSIKGLFPKGSLSEIMGLKSTCKTTLVLHAIAEAIRYNQDNPPVIWWADFENQLVEMKQYAKALGVDITAENFIHKRPSILEDGCQQIIDAVRTGGLDFVVIDSNAAMRPRVEAEKGLGEVHQKGVRGYAISEFIRNLTAEMSALDEKGITPPTVLIINQLYKKLNIGRTNPNAPPQFDSPGSDTIKFFAACRLELKFAGAEVREITNPYTFTKDKIRVCSFIQLFVEKSKVGIPHKKVTFTVRYGEGVDIVMNFLKAAKTLGVIKKHGNSSRLVYVTSTGQESSSFAGLFQLYDYFRNNPEVLADLAKHEKLVLWDDCLKAKLPMMKYARDLMAQELQELQEGESFFEKADGTLIEGVDDL